MTEYLNENETIDNQSETIELVGSETLDFAFRKLSDLAKEKIDELSSKIDQAETGTDRDRLESHLINARDFFQTATEKLANSDGVKNLLRCLYEIRHTTRPSPLQAHDLQLDEVYREVFGEAKRKYYVEFNFDGSNGYTSHTHVVANNAGEAYDIVRKEQPVKGNMMNAEISL